MASRFCAEWEQKYAALEVQTADLLRSNTSLMERTVAAEQRSLEMASKLDGLEAQIKQLTYERDRARMMADSSGSLAEYRMRQVFALQAEVSSLKSEAL